MAVVGVVGALLLFATAGVVLWGGGAPSSPGTAGALRDYSSEPAEAWSIGDADLPDYGTGPVALIDSRGDDWLLSYPTGLGRSITLLDGRSGAQRWPTPVDVGLGDCAITAARTVGCAIKLGKRPDGFYVIDEDGTPQPAGALDDTVAVTAVGNNFLRVTQGGRLASLRTPTGRTVWNRIFSAAATATVVDDVLTVATADGRGFVLDPENGQDILTCAQCDLRVYPQGVLTVRTASGSQRVEVYPRTGTARTVSGQSVRTAEAMTVLSGASILPVLTGVGPTQIMADSGHYEVVDPVTGEGRWNLVDPELSKVHTRPCGTLVAVAMKDRTRRFFTLADGAELGSLPAPEAGDPNGKLDVMSCVGSHETTAVFASGDTLSAINAETGTIAWNREIAGPALNVNGYLALIQGSELIVLQPTAP